MGGMGILDMPTPSPGYYVIERDGAYHYESFAKMAEELAAIGPVNWDYGQCWWCEVDIETTWLDKNTTEFRGIRHKNSCPWMRAATVFGLPLVTDHDCRHVWADAR